MDVTSHQFSYSDLRSNKNLFLITSFLICLFISSYSYAACSSPTANEGAVDYFSAEKIYKVCDGTNWLDYKTDGTLGGCSKEAAIEWDTTESAYKFCDGTNWNKVACASSAVWTNTAGQCSIGYGLSTCSGGVVIDAPCSPVGSACQTSQYFPLCNAVTGGQPYLIYRIECQASGGGGCSTLGTCSKAGATDYFSTDKARVYCDGTNWQVMAQ